MFSAINYQPGTLTLLDQRLLPTESKFIECRNVEEVAYAIEAMVVRGAPAIACTAAFGLMLYVENTPFFTWLEIQDNFFKQCDRLRATRPTAVNLFFAVQEMSKVAREINPTQSKEEVCAILRERAQALYSDDLNTCKRIGEHGASLFPDGKKQRVITHCNTGSLATAGYGTALGVIRSLHKSGKLDVVYVDETRPYMQGARLTAYELSEEGIPFKLICDSASAYLMQTGAIDFAVVGADRIVANGDTANKIGTYSLAVNCHFHKIPFYVAAPLSTFDIKIATGQGIPVEMRSPDEVTSIFGKQIAPLDTEALNPSFDITPGTLIRGIITENGVLAGPYVESIASAL